MGGGEEPQGTGGTHRAEGRGADEEGGATARGSIVDPQKVLGTLSSSTSSSYSQLGDLEDDNPRWLTLDQLLLGFRVSIVSCSASTVVICSFKKVDVSILQM